MCYLTKRLILREGTNRIQKDPLKNKARLHHVGPWVSFSCQQFSRLIDSQILMYFFVFQKRHCDFEPYIEMIDRAIVKIGRIKKG